MELSRREKEILAQIEDGFTPKETAMAQALNSGPARRLQYSPTVRTWLGLLALLALGLTMIPLGILLLDLGPVGVGVLTLGVATPWTLLAATSLAHRTATEQRGTGLSRRRGPWRDVSGQPRRRPRRR